MFQIVKVLEVRPVKDYRLHVSFSDGSSGDHDFASQVREGGPMLEPLRDPAFFARVFVEMGVLAWPNGFDLDAIKLHMDMAEAGELRRDAAA
jgi:hypothetical protein